MTFCEVVGVVAQFMHQEQRYRAQGIKLVVDELLEMFEIQREDAVIRDCALEILARVRAIGAGSFVLESYVGNDVAEVTGDLAALLVNLQMVNDYALQIHRPVELLPGGPSAFALLRAVLGAEGLATVLEKSGNGVGRAHMTIGLPDYWELTVMDLGCSAPVDERFWVIEIKTEPIGETGSFVKRVLSLVETIAVLRDRLRAAQYPERLTPHEIRLVVPELVPVEGGNTK